MAHHSHDGSFVVSAPVHPVPQLQGPFDESMLESTVEADDSRYPDPVTRRNTLLESPTYVRVVAGRWKQKPGERFHPLWKLIAQISFGIHLLAEAMAKSEDDVMQILQAHVDEIDGFLERTTEDFDLAQEDIQERLRCLKLPLSHPATFDKMLEDRNFRLSIVDGNEKIEHIVERTTQALKDSMKDVQKGYETTTCLEAYLQGLARTWSRLSVEHEAVFVAMLGNVEGWRKAFTALYAQGNKLNGSLKKLTDIINEMQARAGEISRRLLHQAKVQTPPSTGRTTGRSTPTSRFATTPKQFPSVPVRPGLRQHPSNDTVSSTSSMRPSSHETLRRQAMLGRSQTPQRDSPSPQFMRNTNSPQIVAGGSDSQARVQSMVPSLLGTATPEGSRIPHRTQPSIDTQPDRYFPPIELPAHVPEETMQKAPMSKQNRLSMGLNMAHAKISETKEKRNSRMGTSALIDLLRAGPPSNNVSGTKLPDASRRTSAVKGFAVQSGDDMRNGNIPANTMPTSRSSSISDTARPHAKKNIRRPKKGVQHWFEAVDDDLDGDDKYSVLSGERVNTMTIAVQPSQTKSDHESQSGTPAWAVTTFAQAEKRKELLKQGAFRSHPPEQPLGSPPTNQSATPLNPSNVATQNRRPSHSSSVGQSTIGEPGPEVAASEAGSISVHSGRYKHVDHNRASTYAPEVVIAELIPALPQSSKHFIAEMEGSSPQLSGVPTHSKHIIMELEAPHHHFVLPPRPQAQLVAAQTNRCDQTNQQPFFLPPSTQQTPTSQPGAPYQQHFVLPPRPQSGQKVVPRTSSQAQVNRESEAVMPNSTTTTSQSTNQICQEQAHMAPVTAEEGKSTLGPAIANDNVQNAASSDETDASIQTDTSVVVDQLPAKLETPPHTSVVDSEDIVEQFVQYKVEDDGERLPSSVYVPTPRIPIPPSPLGNSVYLQANESQCNSGAPEPLYILPALAYKAPSISPSLPPDPRPQEIRPEQERPKSTTSDTKQLASPKSSPSSMPTDTNVKPVATPVQKETEVKPDTGMVEDASTALENLQLKRPEPKILESARPGPGQVDLSPSDEPTATVSSPAHLSTEYDPYRAEPAKPTGHLANEPSHMVRVTKVAPIKVVTATRKVDDFVDEKSRKLSSSSAQGATNEWKAFFTGQPSPVGSTLSIRSIRRESYMEQQQASPALLSPASASGRHPFPPSPAGPAVKEAVFFNMGSKRGSESSVNPNEPVALGITAPVQGEKPVINAS